MKVLISDPLAKQGLDLLKSEFDVDVALNLSPDELISRIGDYDALVVRSETKVTARVIDAARRLRVVARAGVGVDNVDVPAATARGILVVNAPGANTVSTAEHTFGMLLAMARRIPAAQASLKAGKWERKAFVGVELFHKTLGVVGLGRIGAEVSKRARGFGMTVLAYDPFLSAEYAARLGVEKTTLDDVLSRSDFITIHTPLTKETHHLIGARELALVKHGACIVNCARGGLVDEEALLEAIRSGKVAGAALDVFEKEPPGENALLALDQVVATPHLGGSSHEAQVGVSVAAAEGVIAALKGGLVESAVNLPSLSKEDVEALAPYLALAEKMGRLLAGLVNGPIRAIEAASSQEIKPEHASLITAAALQGVFTSIVSEPATLVNARILAERRGIEVVEERHGKSSEFATPVISLRARTVSGVRSLDGTVFNGQGPKILRIDGYRVDVAPVGYMLIDTHVDKPGMIGQAGTILGSHGINIAGMQVGRQMPGGEAVMVLSVDSPISSDVLSELAGVDGIKDLKFVDLTDRQE